MIQLNLFTSLMFKYAVVVDVSPNVSFTTAPSLRLLWVCLSHLSPSCSWALYSLGK